MDSEEKTEIQIYVTIGICWITSLCLLLFKNIVVKWIADRLLRGRSKYTYQKATMSIFKIFSYSFIAFYGYLVLMKEKWVRDTFSYCEPYGSKYYPLKVSFYFIYEFSFYITELQYLLIHYDMKDKNQMVVHHIVTLTLIGGSYFMGYSRYGMVVMAIHDIADPFLESAKLFVYLKSKFMADCIFSFFSFIFVLSRLIIFPSVILYPLGYSIVTGQRGIIEVIYFIFLSSLFIMHLMWARMIGKVAKNVIVNHEVRDVRSNSSDSLDKTKID